MGKSSLLEALYRRCGGSAGRRFRQGLPDGDSPGV